jgi:uncharacterized protein (DUF58 family)
MTRDWVVTKNKMNVIIYRLKNISQLWRITRPDSVTIIEVRQRLALISLVFLLAWLIILPNSLALTGVIVLGLLVLIGLWWARALATQVTCRRELRYTAVQVGDELEESITLTNRSGLPAIWAEFIDRSDFPGYTASGVSVVERHSVNEWRTHTVCLRRGVFNLGPWEIRMGDPFGIFQVRQIYQQRTEILVHPPLAALPPQVQPHSKKVGDLRPLHQPLSAETISVTTTRPYVLGDPLRRVHWRTSARHNDLFVKVFEPEASSSIWLVPDLDAAAHVGAGDESSLETMVVLLASLASTLLNDRLSVGLLADTANPILPQYGAAHFWTILRALALLQPSRSNTLIDTLTRARDLISARDSMIVITPSLKPDWPPALQRLLGRATNSGVEVILLDPASFGGSGDAQLFATLLAEQGIPSNIVRRDEVQPISGTYGEVRRWEFKTLGTGRVAVKQTPRRAIAPVAER